MQSLITKQRISKHPSEPLEIAKFKDFYSYILDSKKKFPQKIKYQKTNHKANAQSTIVKRYLNNIIKMRKFITPQNPDANSIPLKISAEQLHKTYAHTVCKSHIF